MATDLSIAEQRKLSEHEAVIKCGQKAFLRVGKALAAIRDAKLYRDEYETFADYCRDKWGFHRSKAYRFIEAAAVAESVSQICDIGPNESQARALVDVPVEQRADVWKDVVEAAPKDKAGTPKVTARKIAETAARLAPESEQEYDEGDDAEREDDANIAPARQKPNIIGQRKEEFRDWWQAVLTDPPHVAAYMRTFITEAI